MQVTKIVTAKKKRETKNKTYNTIKKFGVSKIFFKEINYFIQQGWIVQKWQ